MFDKIKELKKSFIGGFVIDFMKKPENIKEMKKLISQGVDNPEIAQKLNIPTKYVDKIKKLLS